MSGRHDIAVKGRTLEALLEMFLLVPMHLLGKRLFAAADKCNFCIRSVH